jgi:hypothetical protein
MDIICIKSPQDRATGRLSLLHTAGTIREQFGNRYARTGWWFWHILDVIDGFFPLFPYLLIYRTEEDAGSNPAKSTYEPPPAGFIRWKLWGWFVPKRIFLMVTLILLQNQESLPWSMRVGVSRVKRHGLVSGMVVYPPLLTCPGDDLLGHRHQEKCYLIVYIPPYGHY